MGLATDFSSSVAIIDRQNKKNHKNAEFSKHKNCFGVDSLSVKEKPETPKLGGDDD